MVSRCALEGRTWWCDARWGALQIPGRGGASDVEECIDGKRSESAASALSHAREAVRIVPERCSRWWHLRH